MSRPPSADPRGTDLRGASPRRHPLVVVAVTLVLALVAACSGSDDGRDGTSQPTEPSPTTVPIDYSSVDLEPVPGNTTTTVAMGPGSAKLVGIVSGPDGRVPNAVVRLERLVGDNVASMDVRTGEDGIWEAGGLLGGRFRVRAWRAPDLAITESRVFFLNGSETRSIDMALQAFHGRVVTTRLAARSPNVGAPTNLAVRVTDREVDENGIVRSRGVGGLAVTVHAAGRWEISSVNPATTDGSGNVTFRVTCRAQGPQPLSITTADGDAREVPDTTCHVPPPTTTTTTVADDGDGGDDDGDDGTTTTTTTTG